MGHACYMELKKEQTLGGMFQKRNSSHSCRVNPSDRRVSWVGRTPLADKSPPAPQRSQGPTPGPVCPALTAGWDRHTSGPQSSGVCVQVKSPNPGWLCV